MTILDLLQQDGIISKKVAGTNGGEFAAPCPMCGGTDRFLFWPAQGQGGKWWCRQCGKGGDLIQYVREVRGMTYLEACRYLGREPAPMRRTLNWNRQPTGDKWQPKKTENPVADWTEKANSFVSWAECKLWGDAGRATLEWLRAERGLTDETIKAFHLGWNPKDFWRPRQAWGLEPIIKENGKPKKLWLPRGLVISRFDQTGQVVKAKIRRPEPDAEPRYYLLPGSETSPLIFEGGNAAMVVESELDLLILSQVAGDLVSLIALGSAQVKPDEQAHGILTGATAILVSLDGDQAGAKAAWGWWSRTYPQAKRWPPVLGKDPGDMLKAGVDLLTWVRAGLSDPEPETTTPVEMATEPQLQIQPEAPEQYEKRIKCRDCQHPDKETLTCAKGQSWWGLQLLHECQDFRPTA